MRRRRIFRYAGAIALLALVALAVVAPGSAAQGWLTATVFWSTVAVGSLVVLMIHRLTGGRWGETCAPVLVPTAAGVPWLALLVVAVVVSAGVLYPWHDRAHVDASVASAYLNVPLFAVRSAIALAGWSAIAIVLPPLSGSRSLLVAGVGLAFHAIAISVIPVDWILSTAPGFTSSAFGATIAVSQILAGIAWCAVWAPLPDDQAAADIAGLLLAAILGLVYMAFISFAVIWYGDVPEKIAWYLNHAGGWGWMSGATFIVGALVPVALLLLGRRLGMIRAARSAGACALAGLMLYDLWLIAPQFGAAAVLPAGLGLIAIGGLWLGFSAGRTAERPAHA